MLEVYMDDMIVKSHEETDHAAHLRKVFEQARRSKMRSTLRNAPLGSEQAKCEQALQHLKKALSEPPVLSRPDDEEVLYLYLSVASEAVDAALIRETTEGQKPIYFISKALQGPELRYQLIEKVALALVNATRRLRH
ncbi:maturase K [Trifolium medium]|uniref:Maturase K n=1 Tax=Trifolium medium TaxID=97028 RepID=A0A392N8M3_9FABA|nr:maturase K [Trifolium medium]